MRGTFSRRRLLAGAAAAAGVGVPLLGARSTRAADERPSRLILMPLLNGVEHQYFWPGPAGSVVTEPLAGFMDRLTFVRGLDMEGSWDHMAVRSMFTGAPINSYEAPDPQVRSLDQVVADHFESTAPAAHRSIHLGALPASSIEDIGHTCTIAVEHTCGPAQCISGVRGHPVAGVDSLDELACTIELE